MKIKTQDQKSKADTQARQKRQPKKPKKITETYLHNSGLYYLQRYASSVENFKKVMKRKVKKSCMAHPEQKYDDCARLVDDLAQKFISSGLLNDDLYTESMVRSLRRQGKSRRAIQMKLTQKGLNGEDISQALEKHDAISHENEQQAERFAAVRIMRKRRLGPFDLQQSKTPEKSMAALARAGFSYEIIRSVLEMNLEEAEEVLYQGERWP